MGDDIQQMAAVEIEHVSETVGYWCVPKNIFAKIFLDTLSGSSLSGFLEAANECARI